LKQSYRLTRVNDLNDLNLNKSRVALIVLMMDIIECNKLCSAVQVPGIEELAVQL